MRARLVVLVWVSFALVSCGKRSGTGDPQGHAGAGAGVGTGAEAGARERVAAAVITVAHAEVEHYAGARAKPNRTKEESFEMARAIVQELRKDPSRFRELAASRSEDPFGAQGGEFQAWIRGDDKELDEAVGHLGQGEISEPVDTHYGYRIFLRIAPLPAERISARHVTVAWAGAARAPKAVTRTKGEALERARELSQRARREPGAFEALIRAESDGWDKERGGSLGHWMADGSRYPVGWGRAIVTLSEGAVSDPVESEFGYQIFQRTKPQPEIPSLSGAHILIAFQGAEKARPNVRRSRIEAETEAKRIAAEARTNPERFGQLAVKHSDDVSGRLGGDLGTWQKGAMPEAIDEKFASLKIGEIGDPVLTPFGYHVLVRREAPSDKAYVVK